MELRVPWGCQVPIPCLELVPIPVLEMVPLSLLAVPLLGHLEEFSMVYLNVYPIPFPFWWREGVLRP